MVKKFRLPNGLTVLLVESHKSPVVSVQMWVHIGSADEKPQVRGISHFIEHLVFKGTKKFKVGEIAATVEGSGGELNAYTSFDQTVFYVTISKVFVDTGLEIIAEMMGRPTFSPDEIENEREVVIEEIKRSLDSSHRQASRMLFESMYRHHPYGQPVIGFEEIIRKVSPQEISKYFQEHYHPKNMTLVVVGDFKINEIKPRIKELYANMSKRKGKQLKRKKESSPLRAQAVVRGSNFKENFLFLSWPTIKADHKDMPALEALALILGQGDSSRLNQVVRLEKKLVNYIGCSLFSARDPGFLAVSGSLPPGKITPVLKEIKNVIQELQKSGPTQDELEKAIVNMQSEQFYGLETVEGLARKFGHFEHVFSDYNHFKKYIAQVLKLQPKDIQAVAKKYLQPSRLVVSSLTPEANRADTENEVKLFTKAAESEKPIKSVKASKKAKGKFLPSKWIPNVKPEQRSAVNRVEKHILGNGMTVLMKPNYETPVVSLRLASFGGARAEGPDEAGLTELLSRCWVSATKKSNEKEINDRIDRVAANLSAFGGRNSAGLTLTALYPFWQEMEDLLSEVLLEPKITAEIVNREKALMLEQLRTRLDNPAQVAMLNFNQQAFSNHPYGRDLLGSKESLEKIDATKLNQHLARMVKSNNITVAVTGCFLPEEVNSGLEKIGKILSKGDKLLKPERVQWPSHEVHSYTQTQKEQSHLVIGYPGLTMLDEERYILHVLEAILAGQGGRLFLELRDKASLAYSVSPIHMEGYDAGYFGAYIGCAPEKAEKALRMLKEQFSRLVEELVPEKELQRAQRYLIGRHDIELQKASAISAALLFDDMYGLPLEETFHYAERINKVTREQLQKAAQKIFSATEVVSLVGPRPIPALN